MRSRRRSRPPLRHALLGHGNEVGNEVIDRGDERIGAPVHLSEGRALSAEREEDQPIAQRQDIVRLSLGPFRHGRSIRCRGQRSRLRPTHPMPAILPLDTHGVKVRE